jgi:hypothetical protein
MSTVRVVPDVADHAFAHCVAVLVGTDPATACAAEAVRRGGRTRPAVLAFARQAALEATAEPPIPDFEPGDLAELAWGLATTRTPSSRAVVDLQLRHDLDRAALGRALGLAPSDAAALAAGVAEDWGRDLDPALLAWLGPRGCEGLRDVLVANGLWTVPDPGHDEGDTAGSPAAGRSIAHLLGVVAEVNAHTEQCEPCADRRRAMVSVHTLVGQRPLEAAPEAVRAGAHRSPFRVGNLPGPSPEHAAAVGRVERRRASPRAVKVAIGTAAAVFVGLGAFGIAIAAGRPTSQDKRNTRVAALTKVAATGSALTLSPPAVRASSGAMQLRNTSDRVVQWKATAGVSWLMIAPDAGELRPGAATELDTRILDSAPEGDLSIPVTVQGDDGSAAGALVEASIEHPPTLAASITGCSVQATAVDEGDVRSVFLHWRTQANTTDHVLQMVAAGPPDTYFGTVPAGDNPTSWWVTAVDGRGNRGQTTEVAVTPHSC